jgi:hypothetical protein
MKIQKKIKENNKNKIKPRGGRGGCSEKIERKIRDNKSGHVRM